MGILEIVFNSRKFDLNDDVLMGFDNYFDKKSKDYNSFCLDEEDINPLQNFVAQIKSADSDSVIYVSEYYGAAEPPVQCGESHLSGLTEPPHFVY